VEYRCAHPAACVLARVFTTPTGTFIHKPAYRAAPTAPSSATPGPPDRPETAYLLSTFPIAVSLGCDHVQARWHADAVRADIALAHRRGSATGRRISGSLDLWISGSLDLWISGSLDLWISGSAVTATAYLTTHNLAGVVAFDGVPTSSLAHTPGGRGMTTPVERIGVVVLWFRNTVTAVIVFVAVMIHRVNDEATALAVSLGLRRSSTAHALARPLFGVSHLMGRATGLAGWPAGGHVETHLPHKPHKPRKVISGVVVRLARLPRHGDAPSTAATPADLPSGSGVARAGDSRARSAGPEPGRGRPRCGTGPVTAR